MFLKLGGTEKCNRYTSNQEVNDIESNSINNNKQQESEQELLNEPHLITSINDMVAYIETNYTSKIMSIFLSDAKTIVSSILDDINTKKENELKKKNQRNSQVYTYLRLYFS